MNGSDVRRGGGRAWLARCKGMLSIGQFSRVTGLTLKTIRLYHEKEPLTEIQILFAERQERRGES
ncbi:MAG: hypothetical protein MUF51_07180 [Vicinamibacteria bacterium]|jgi:hypothetical protein|nr:hypothetical protein [Vicinamibacteria bacterium]